jgi:hypothetical protein
MSIVFRHAFMGLPLDGLMWILYKAIKTAKTNPLYNNKNTYISIVISSICILGNEEPLSQPILDLLLDNED